MLRIQLLILTSLIGVTAFGQDQQNKTVNQKDQFWWSINTTTRLTDNLGIVGDFHIRRDDFIKESNFYFTRVGAAFWVTDRLTLVGGYAHLWLSKSFENHDNIYQNENRVYQQIQWRQKVGRVTFVQRIRNEQRWHEVLDSDGLVDRIRFSNRVRFLSSFNVKVFENSKMPSISIADEVHMHFGKEIIYNTFDQNRIFAGLKVPISKNLKFDIGYMLVYQQRYAGNEYDMNHTFRWFFYYAPDFRGNKGSPHYALPGDE